MQLWEMGSPGFQEGGVLLSHVPSVESEPETGARSARRALSAPLTIVLLSVRLGARPGCLCRVAATLLLPLPLL